MPVEAATWKWLQFVARRWQRQSATPLHVLFAGRFNNRPQVADAATEAVRLALDTNTTIASGSGHAGAPDPGWSAIPPHAHHVLFCQGPRCTAAGAAEVGARLRMRLKEEGLDRVTQNFATLRNITHSMLKRESTLKAGIQGKRLQAGWDENHLLKVLNG